MDVRPDSCGPLIDQLGKDDLHWVVGDVRAKADWIRVIEESLVKFGPPDVLVNNAGIARANRLDSITESEYRSLLDINQIGVFRGMQAVVPPMKKKGSGSIINMSSTAGLVGLVDNFAYVASKWAVRGMTKAAALELASNGIRVNSVCPGDTDTPLLRANSTALPPESSRFGRWADPAEIAAAVVFLASADSTYVSGTDIIVDGTHTAA